MLYAELVLQDFLSCWFDCMQDWIVLFPKSFFNSLPNIKNFDVTKLKAFADDRINEAHMIIFSVDGVEKIVGKGENAGYQHFLLFPQCFLRLPFVGSSKGGILW